MPVIITDQHDHPCINAHKSKGHIFLTNGTSLPFDSLYYSESCYYIEYNQDDRSTIVVTSDLVEIIKYG